MARNMPTGVEVAPLGWRLLGWLIDLSVPIVVGGVVWFLLGSMGPTQFLVISILAGLVQLGWSLLLWWGYATRGAGVGFQVVNLQVVGLKNGKPIGWWKYFVRQLVFSAIAGTVVGGIALAIFLVIHERRQGWHDMAGGSVAIRRRRGAAKATKSSQQRPKGHSTTVALPPHLIAAAFDPARNAGAEQAQTDTAAQAWQASQFGGGGVTQDTSWRPPTDPGATTGAQRRVSAAGQPVPGGPPQPQMQPQMHQPQVRPQVQQPQVQQSVAQQQPAVQPGLPQPGMPQPGMPQPGMPQPGMPQPGLPQPPVAQPPVQPPTVQPPAQQSAPAVPPQWSPPAASQTNFETTVRPLGRIGEDDLGGTRMVSHQARSARPMTEGWFLRLNDGRMIPVEGLVLLGRNPSSADGTPATLVPIGEDGHTVSKTHLAVGVDQRGVHVTDRGSTNGTALINTKGELEPCLPGIQARVREGQVVSFGDHSFTLMRRPPEG